MAAGDVGTYKIYPPSAGSTVAFNGVGQGGSLAPWFIETSTGNFVNPIGGQNINGIRLGPTTTSGVILSLVAANTLRMISGDGSLNSVLVGLFRSALIDGSVQFSDSTSQGGAGFSFFSDNGTAVTVYARIVRQRMVQASKTGNYSVVVADTGTAFDNVGAAGTVVFTLPAATVGQTYTFNKVVGQILTITPQAGDTIRFNGLTKAAGASVSTNANTGTDWQSCTLMCFQAGFWIATSAVGTWA